MTGTLDPTVAARIPAERRAELLELAHADGVPASALINRALAEYLERRRTGADLFAPRQGTTRRHDRETSRRAAADTAPRTGTGRRRALEVIVDAGDYGATTDEVLAALEVNASLDGERSPAANGVARRVSDLLEVGAIEEARIVNGAGTGPLTRATRHGSDAIVWRVTVKGRQWLREENARA